MDIIITTTSMNKYIDCHSHILYGIDDGAKTIEDSIAILKKMQDLGFESIILTPHYRGDYKANNLLKSLLLDSLNSVLDENNINIKLYLANEVRITSNMLELLEKETIKTINDYFFLELPFTNKIYNLDKIIYELQSNNLKVVLVHPERYPYLTLNDFQKLVDNDVLLQVNYESIIGKYGFASKRMAKKLFKNNLVHLLGTDVHRDTTIMFSEFETIKKKIIKIIGEEEFENLSYNNVKRIIDNDQ